MTHYLENFVCTGQNQSEYDADLFGTEKDFMINLLSPEIIKKIPARLRAMLEIQLRLVLEVKKYTVGQVEAALWMHAVLLPDSNIKITIEQLVFEKGTNRIISENYIAVTKESGLFDECISIVLLILYQMIDEIE